MTTPGMQCKIGQTPTGAIASSFPQTTPSSTWVTPTRGFPCRSRCSARFFTTTPSTGCRGFRGENSGWQRSAPCWPRLGGPSGSGAKSLERVRLWNLLLLGSMIFETRAKGRKQMKIRIFMGVLFLNCVCMAQTVSTKGLSLDKVQVLALLSGDVSNSRVASLVVERGITFEPNERYVQLLQKVGADEGVVTAVRVTPRPPAGPMVEGSNGPLQRDQILDLLQTGVDSKVLANLVATRGIDFEPFDDY